MKATVAAMKRVIVYTQENTPPDAIAEVLGNDHTQRAAIGLAAVKLAEDLGVEAFVAETKSGATARDIAAFRPNLPIISVTSEQRTAQQLALAYANKSFVRPDGEIAGLSLAKELQSQNFFDETIATVVIVSGRQPGLVGGTDTIRVRVIE